MSEALVNGLAGAGGGLVAQLLTYPLQNVNTRQQTERKAKRSKDFSIDANSLQNIPRKQFAQGTIPGLYQVINEEGWTGLYRGLTPSLLGTAASQGVYYYFYQIFRNAAESRSQKRKEMGMGDGTVGMFSSLVVAAFAGCVNVLLTNPFWVIVTRMQTQTQVEKNAKVLLKPSVDDHGIISIITEEESNTKEDPKDTLESDPHGLTHTVQELYHEAGFLGFWKGVLPTLIMVSNPSIQFMIYETLLKRKRKISKRKGVSAAEIFYLGAIAKLGATVATYPFLVVKSRLQAKQEIGGDKALRYSGTLDAILKMVQLEGLGGFYKGMSTKILQSVMAAAVLFVVKEELVKMAHGMLNKQQKIRKLKAVAS